jgi:hypothetical protein
MAISVDDYRDVVRRPKYPAHFALKTPTPEPIGLLNRIEKNFFIEHSVAKLSLSQPE